MVANVTTYVQYNASPNNKSELSWMGCGRVSADDGRQWLEKSILDGFLDNQDNPPSSAQCQHRAVVDTFPAGTLTALTSQATVRAHRRAGVITGEKKTTEIPRVPAFQGLSFRRGLHVRNGLSITRTIIL